MNTEEKWLPIEEWGGRYEVSDQGNVRDAETRRVRVLSSSSDRYVQFAVYMESEKGRVCKNNAVHRLVAKAFIPNPERKPVVNHIDGCKNNNAVSNLEWATYSENGLHAYRTGLNPRRGGELSGRAILTNNKVGVIWRLSAAGYGPTGIARMIGGISRCAIYDVLRRKSWTGYSHQQL